MRLAARTASCCWGGLENASVVAVRQPCDLRLLTGVRPLEEPVALCVIPKVPYLLDQPCAGVGVQGEVKAPVGLTGGPQVALAQSGRPLEVRGAWYSRARSGRAAAP